MGGLKTKEIRLEMNINEQQVTEVTEILAEIKKVRQAQLWQQKENRKLQEQVEDLKERLEHLENEKKNEKPSSQDVYSKKVNKKVDKKLEENIYRFLRREVGFPPQVLGYKYITDILIMSLVGELEFPGCNITQVVYPEIARIHKTTPSRVDRTIRHAIDITWKKGGNLDKKIEVFGNASYEGKPTNAYFLASIIEYIKHEM